ncbi:hypothetical protein VULLAG_LOCUS20242 [Vulpes lagopus]
MAACQNQSPSPGSCVALGHRVPSQPTLEVLPETEVNICATEGISTFPLRSGSLCLPSDLEREACDFPLSRLKKQTKDCLYGIVECLLF